LNKKVCKKLISNVLTRFWYTFYKFKKYAPNSAPQWMISTDIKWK